MSKESKSKALKKQIAAIKANGGGEKKPNMNQPYEESLLSHVQNKDKKKSDDWQKRAKSGEVMRIM